MEDGRILGVYSGVAMENRLGFLNRMREKRSILGYHSLASTWLVTLKVCGIGRWFFTFCSVPT